MFMNSLQNFYTIIIRHDNIIILIVISKCLFFLKNKVSGSPLIFKNKSFILLSESMKIFYLNFRLNYVKYPENNLCLTTRLRYKILNNIKYIAKKLLVKIPVSRWRTHPEYSVGIHHLLTLLELWSPQPGGRNLNTNDGRPLLSYILVSTRFPRQSCPGSQGHRNRFSRKSIDKASDLRSRLHRSESSNSTRMVKSARKTAFRCGTAGRFWETLSPRSQGAWT